MGSPLRCGGGSGSRGLVLILASDYLRFLNVAFAGGGGGPSGVEALSLPARTSSSVIFLGGGGGDGGAGGIGGSGFGGGVGGGGGTGFFGLSAIRFSPSRLGRFCSDLGAFLAAKFSSTSMAAFESAKTPEGDGSGILGRLYGRFILWSLASGLKHDLVGQFVRVAGSLL